jgi:hypothetical protein
MVASKQRGSKNSEAGETSRHSLLTRSAARLRYLAIEPDNRFNNADSQCCKTMMPLHGPTTKASER